MPETHQSPSHANCHRRAPQRGHAAAQCSFAGLMELYEANYIRLRTLIGHMRGARGRWVSVVPGCLSLHLEFLDDCPYTTTLLLSYQFPPEHGVAREPDLRVQVYHDARVAEVIGRSAARGRFLREAGQSLLERWRRNRFLYRWLGYCLYRGHKFRVALGAPAAAASDGGQPESDLLSADC